jgi:hypothetical protein
MSRHSQAAARRHVRFMTIRLSDAELDIVMLAARPLPRHVHDTFLRRVADELARCTVVGPGTVHRVCAAAQTRPLRSTGFQPVEISLEWCVRWRPCTGCCSMPSNLRAFKGGRPQVAFLEAEPHAARPGQSRPPLSSRHRDVIGWTDWRTRNRNPLPRHAGEIPARGAFALAHPRPLLRRVG